MNAEERTALLERYVELSRLLRESVAGASLAQLDGAPPEPGWTARTIVHHVSDVAVMGALRLRMMLLDVVVELWPIEQDDMQVRLRNDQRPIEGALATVEGLTASAASILESLSEEEWLAPRPMPQGPPRSVAEWLAASVSHMEGHIDQIRDALTGTC